MQADKGDGLQEGIIGLVNKGQPRKLDDWGALRAWAWGASRCLDYFETDKSVDAKQVGITGHSRYGKASLVAMAYDPRFAIAYISSSGAGGAELYRRNFGEQMGNLAGTGEYHWFAGNFIKYDGPLVPKDLPVDSHELIALCAPRPVFIGGGATQGDGWADAKGTFLAAVGAGPVYKLLGKKPVGTVESGQFTIISATQFPPIETPSSTATSPSANTAPATPPPPTGPPSYSSPPATSTAPTPHSSPLAGLWVPHPRCSEGAGLDPTPPTPLTTTAVANPPPRSRDRPQIAGFKSNTTEPQSVSPIVQPSLPLLPSQHTHLHHARHVV